MSRGDQLLRQWNLLKTLQTRGVGMTLRDLASEFEVAERTIQRDFELLQESGFPIDFEQDETGRRYWRLPHDFFRSGPLVLSLTEAVSLHLAHNMFTSLAGTHFAEGLESLLAKIRGILPARVMDHFADLDQSIYVRRVGRADYSDKAGIIRALAEAAREQISVEMTYHALWSGERYTTRTDPYGLVYYNDDLFFVGFSHRSRDVRVFKVARIDAVEKTEHRFRRPDGFSLEGFFRNSFGIVQSSAAPVDIAVRFRGAAATLIEERVWHQTQRLAWLSAEDTLFEHADGEPEALVATFRLSNVVEFKRWLRGFADQAEVLRPDWLRAEMRGELLSAARQYDGFDAA
ncbi:MAG: helix-turn-helix transcriptional regulator [Phycisphaerae bacterium]